MECAGDIALGNFSTADLNDLVGVDSVDERNQQQLRPVGILRFSVALSVCIHLAIATTVFYFIASDNRREEDIVPATLRVEFVTSNPLMRVAEQTPPENVSEDPGDSNQNFSSIPVDEVVTSPLVVEEPLLENAEIEVADAVAIETAETDVVFSGNVDSIVIPSRDSVQSAIDAVQRSEASRFYSYDCNKIEEEEEFNNCAPSDTRNYGAVTKNPVYDFYNPAIEISRSRQAVTTIAKQSAGVSQALALSSLPAGLSAYVLDEIELGIETYSNSSSRAVNHMNTMVDKSAAGAMARSMFDHWVVQQSAEIKARRVENRSDVMLEDRCKSYEKFIMAPAEFAQCLMLGISPLEFTIGY